jgi:hypothetical protein
MIAGATAPHTASEHKRTAVRSLEGLLRCTRGFSAVEQAQRKVARPELSARCAREAVPDDIAMLTGCAIKGHYAVRAWPSVGIYHLPDCGNYRRTQAKRWLCSEEEALATGFPQVVHMRLVVRCFGFGSDTVKAGRGEFAELDSA